MSKRNRKSRKQVDSDVGPAPVGPVEASSGQSSSTDFFRKHLLIGWWSLLIFLTLGLVLEAMHGFKVQWYVGAQNSTRRLMFTLGHAHGTMLSLVHIAFAFSVRELARYGSVAGATSWCLVLAGILLPVGFLVGGAYTFDGDPGLGILMVPIGGVLLLVSVLMTALSVHSMTKGTGDQ